MLCVGPSDETSLSLLKPCFPNVFGQRNLLFFPKTYYYSSESILEACYEQVARSTCRGGCFLPCVWHRAQICLNSCEDVSPGETPSSVTEEQANFP